MQENNEEIKGAEDMPVAYKKKVGFWANVWDLLKFAALATIIVLPIRAYVAQPFVVSGRSMVPTFQNGQYLIVDEISYRFHSPQRGDVIIFKYPKDPTKYFIKRVIGLPGETVEIKGNDIKIYNSENPDGLKLDQPYVENVSSNELKTMLGETDYFVMGDNRRESSDSRYWGALPRDMIVGRALLRLLPLAQASYLPGDFKN